MKTISRLDQMQEESQAWLTQGKSVGFVPTMGALHQGHLSLVKQAKPENEITVASIFVNPAQFGPKEDFHTYPRTLTKDLDLLNQLNIDIAFTPDARAMFPPGFQTRVRVERLSKPLCGESRPAFFSGAATVVLKLFHLVLPTRAYFGNKDYQQLQVVRRMAKDLNLKVEIVACPTLREPDGLAMSSRNLNLSSDARKAAPLLYAALKEGEQALHHGERSPAVLKDLMQKKITQIPDACIDYVAIVDPLSLAPLIQVKDQALLAIAVRIGQVRLIDNVLVKNNQKTDC